jgi:hypothetical protein
MRHQLMLRGVNARNFIKRALRRPAAMKMLIHASSYHRPSSPTSAGLKISPANHDRSYSTIASLLIASLVDVSRHIE